MPPLSPLHRHGLRDTLPRRNVLRVLVGANRILTIPTIQRRLRVQKQQIGLVTLYRVTKALERVGLVHRHPDGGLSACTQPHMSCGHLILRCTSCGSVKETHDHRLCKSEESVSKRAGFRVLRTILDIPGLCSHCQPG